MTTQIIYVVYGEYSDKSGNELLYAFEAKARADKLLDILKQAQSDFVLSIRQVTYDYND